MPLDLSDPPLRSRYHATLRQFLKQLAYLAKNEQKAEVQINVVGVFMTCNATLHILVLAHSHK